MFRSFTVLCGAAVGSYLATKGINVFERQNEDLKAGDVTLQCKNLDLKLVQVLFRHGARTPLKLIPGLEETIWNKYELRYDLEHTKVKYELRHLKGDVLLEEAQVRRDVLRVCYCLLSAFN